LEPLTLRDWPRIAKRVLNRAVLAEMNGPYGASWAWQVLTLDKLRAHWKAAKCWRYREAVQRWQPQ